MLLSEPCRLWPRFSKRWGLLRAAHRDIKLYWSGLVPQNKNTVTPVHIWNAPSTGCRNSEGSSWQVGTDPSSSSSCSVPICIPEYWLSLPSSTLCRHREQTVKTQDWMDGRKKLKATACKSAQIVACYWVWFTDVTTWTQWRAQIKTTSKTNSISSSLLTHAF